MVTNLPQVKAGCGSECSTHPIVYIIEFDSLRVHRTQLARKYWVCGKNGARCTDCLVKLGYAW